MLQIFFRKVATLALHFGVPILSWLRCIVAMVLRCFCHGFFIGLLKKHFRFVLIWVTQYQLIWVTRFQLIRVTFFYVSLSCRCLCLGVSIFCMLFFSNVISPKADWILLWIPFSICESLSGLNQIWGPTGVRSFCYRVVCIAHVQGNACRRCQSIRKVGGETPYLKKNSDLKKNRHECRGDGVWGEAPAFLFLNAFPCVIRVGIDVNRLSSV